MSVNTPPPPLSSGESGQKKNPASTFGDLASVLTFAGSQAAAFGIVVYATGFILVQNFNDQLNVPAHGYDLPPNVIYAYALSVFARNSPQVLGFLYEVAGLYVVAAILASLKMIPADVYRALLIVGTALAVVIALMTSYRWANDIANHKVMEVRLCNTSTRVGFILTHDAKKKYDRRFVELSTRIDLRLVREASDIVYAIRREPASRLGDWRYFTYGVPRSDTIVTIRRDLPRDPTDPPQWC